MSERICSRCANWARGFNDDASDMRSPMGRCFADAHDVEDWESTRFDESCDRFKARGLECAITAGSQAPSSPE